MKGRRKKEGGREEENKTGIEAGGKGSLTRTENEMKESRSITTDQSAKAVLSSSTEQQVDFPVGLVDLLNGNVKYLKVKFEEIQIYFITD